jgi:hypothetical protein
VWWFLDKFAGAAVEQLGTLTLEALKRILHRLAKRRSEEWLLIPEFVLEYEKVEIIVQVIVSKPDEAAITRFFSIGSDEIFAPIGPLLSFEGLAKIVLHQASDGLIALYGLRSDGILLLGSLENIRIGS